MQENRPGRDLPEHDVRPHRINYLGKNNLAPNVSQRVLLLGASALLIGKYACELLAC